MKAIKKVAIGDKYIHSDIAEQLISDLREDTTEHGYRKLSNREFQVMCMIATGKSIHGIAQELNLASSTVSTLKKRILIKMNFENNNEITEYVLREGLLNLNPDTKFVKS